MSTRSFHQGVVRLFLASTLLLAGVSGCLNRASPEPEGALLAHIVSGPDAPQRVLMGLTQALETSKAGYDVMVYLDVDAVAIAVRGGEDVKLMDWQSSRKLIADLVAADVPIYVCPRCLATAGYQPEELREGIELASPDRLFEWTDSARIVTLDH
ncbi:MAG: hypothetical protein HC927_13670 [Deltaproteobacteria bacterium]|nr:hypothetical protein [Deltaproteobacteria bacterium]